MLKNAALWLRLRRQKSLSFGFMTKAEQPLSVSVWIGSLVGADGGVEIRCQRFFGAY